MPHSTAGALNQRYTVDLVVGQFLISPGFQTDLKKCPFNTKEVVHLKSSVIVTYIMLKKMEYFKGFVGQNLSCGFEGVSGV